MQTEYRVISAVLLIIGTALVTSAPAIQALIPTSGPWAWLGPVFGILVIAIREWIKQKGQVAESETTQ